MDQRNFKSVYFQNHIYKFISNLTLNELKINSFYISITDENLKTVR